MPRKNDGYNVYHAPDGCGETYIGHASTLRTARMMAARHARRGGGLPQFLYDTARVAGHCGGVSAPDKTIELPEPAAWFGRGGWYCAVPVVELRTVAR